VSNFVSLCDVNMRISNIMRLNVLTEANLMKPNLETVLVELGVPPRVIGRLLADDEAILCLGDLSFTLMEGEIQCFDHVDAMSDPFDVSANLGYAKDRVAIALVGGDVWSFVDDEPQRVAVMSLGVETARVESHEVMA